MFLTRISIAQPVFATMIMVAIMVFGIFSFQRLPIEQMPDVDFPVVAVVVAYPGAAPEAVEADIVKPIEDAVSTIQGLDQTQGIAQAGQAMVIMMFDLEVDSQTAAQDVRDKIAQIAGSLPENSNDPVTLRFDPAALPIMSLAVSSDILSERDLTAVTEDVIAQQILNIQGVGSASVVGGVDRQLNFLLDPDRLNAFNVSVGEVISAVAAENKNRPAGSIEEGRQVQSIQVEGEIDRAEEFLDIIVARRGDSPVRLGDVARLEDGQSDVTSIALLDGSPALAIDIVKTQGSNTVEIAHQVRAAVAELQASDELAGVKIDIVRDNAEAVEDSYKGVQNMLLEGAALATVIVFLFLNSWRSTVITGLTLPISIIGTMSVLYFLGFTLNMMTMLALSLAVGLLIDDAIVVRENIMRHLHMGKSHRQAAMDGTNEIGLAVLATTLSIVAVFLPVAFMEGIIGRFFLQFGVTVSVAVLISLFVAFTLDPMMSSVWYDPSADPNRKKGIIWKAINLFDRFFEGVSRAYIAVLKWCLRFRKTTLIAALLAFVGSFVLVPAVGVEFVPQTDNGEFTVTVETPVGSSLDYTASKLRQIDAVLRQFPEVARTYATVASGTTTTGNNTGTIAVSMVPQDQRTRSPNDMSVPVREALSVIPGITVTVGIASGMGGGATSPIDVSISGPSLDRLQPLADELVRRLQAIDGVVDVESSLELAQPVLGVRVNRDLASDQGVSMAQVGAALAPMLGGETVGDWTDPQGRTYDLNIRLPEEMRNDAALLGALPIAAAPGGGAMLRLDQVAEIVPSFGASQINRLDGQRTINVTASLAGTTLGAVLPLVQAAMAELDLPPGYRVSTGGDQEALADSGASAGAALLLAVIFIYLVLASQFGSFLQPVAIMFSLPLSLIGVMVGLLVGGSTLNIFSMIGFIMLMGLVVKNAILLVDNANQRRREGMNLFDALVSAGHTRFRPIIMTTLAMIFGMLPLALNLHGGSGENAPMAHAVIGGLISSTILTLVVVPVVLTYIDSFGRLVARMLPRAPDEGHHKADQGAGVAAE